MNSPEAAEPLSTGGRRGRPRLTPALALALVLVCFTTLAAGVLALTPPWEANDEPDHVQNIETLAGGHWYRITHDANFESVQAPLYYLVLAAYQRALRQPPRQLYGRLGPITPGQQHGNYLHTGPQDGRDQRLVDLLRLPSVLFGLLAIVLTYFAARRLSRDTWTPVVAAALVAGVPKFVFVSGVVNNDNLANLLGAAGLAAALGIVVAKPRTSRARAIGAAGIGVLAGAIVLTKITAAMIVPGMLVAVLLAAPDRREALQLTIAFLLAALVVCGWYFVQNQVRYGDLLAAAASDRHQREVFPVVFNVASPLRRIFDQIPRDFYSSFWYDSGWNQFSWRWFWYLPFWGLAAIGIGAMLWRSRAPRPGGRDPLLVCALFAAGAIAAVWVVGVHANTEQGRYAFISLPAIAILIALGYERLGLPVGWRFALPAIGLIGTIVAIRYHVIIPYVNLH